MPEELETSPEWQRAHITSLRLCRVFRQVLRMLGIPRAGSCADGTTLHKSGQLSRKMKKTQSHCHIKK